jgi:antitoxin (DNA-binding transcriptional repressor) of toxin-antitoxin stability system
MPGILPQVFSIFYDRMQTRSSTVVGSLIAQIAPGAFLSCQPGILSRAGFPAHPAGLGLRGGGIVRTGQRAGGTAIIGDMGTVHITEAELARDLHDILAKVQQGVEVVVEQDHQPVAVLRPLNRSGRPVSDILREARQRNSTVTLDEDFGKDMEEIIASQQEPWNPPSWE